MKDDDDGDVRATTRTARNGRSIHNVQLLRLLLMTVIHQQPRTIGIRRQPWVMVEEDCRDEEPAAPARECRCRRRGCRDCRCCISTQLGLDPPQQALLYVSEVQVASEWLVLGSSKKGMGSFGHVHHGPKKMESEQITRAINIFATWLSYIYVRTTNVRSSTYVFVC